MVGNADVRETSASGLGHLVRRTSLQALQPFVIQITGPLIRVVGDKFNPNVKSAILQTLGYAIFYVTHFNSLLLQKVPTMLRPFLPQLQRTFVKSLSDASPLIRSTSASCLTSLIPLQPRLDPLVSELLQAFTGTEDHGVRVALLDALTGLVQGVITGQRELNDASKNGLENLFIHSYETSLENDGIYPLWYINIDQIHSVKVLQNALPSTCPLYRYRLANRSYRATF